MLLLDSVEDFPDNSTQSIQVDQYSLLLVKQAGEFYCYTNSCPHTGESLDPMGGSVATAGGLLLKCQRHAAEFVSNTGECVTGACQGEYLEAVPVIVSGGGLYLD